VVAEASALLATLDAYCTERASPMPYWYPWFVLGLMVVTLAWGVAMLLHLFG